MLFLPVVGELAVQLVGVGAERRAHATLRGDVHHQTQILLHQSYSWSVKKGKKKSIKYTSRSVAKPTYTTARGSPRVKVAHTNITYQHRSLRCSLCWQARWASRRAQGYKCQSSSIYSSKYYNVHGLVSFSLFTLHGKVMQICSYRPVEVLRTPASLEASMPSFTPCI